MSIIIPTFNRSDYVIQTLAQLRDQSIRNFELQVIDQSDEDQAEANCKAFATTGDGRVTYRRCLTRGMANARNEGLACANDEIIVFLDDDVILLNDDFLRCHQLEAYPDPTIGGVISRPAERTNRDILA